MDWELEYDAIERGVRAVLDEQGRATLKKPQLFLGLFNDLEPEHKDEAEALRTFFDAGLGNSLYAVKGSTAEEQAQWLQVALQILTISGMAEKDARKLLAAVGKGVGLTPQAKPKKKVEPESPKPPTGEPRGGGSGHVAAGPDLFAAFYLAQLKACVPSWNSKINSILLKDGTRLWLPKNNAELKRVADFIGYPEIYSRNRIVAEFLWIYLGLGAVTLFNALFLGAVAADVAGILMLLSLVASFVQDIRFWKLKNALIGFAWEIEDTGKVNLGTSYNDWRARCLASYSYNKDKRPGRGK